MKEQRLFEARTGIERVDLRIDVAIGDENVEPGIVVHVETCCAPTDVRIAWLTDTRRPTNIVKAFLAPVAIERIGLLLKVGYEEAEPSAVVEVAPVHAHVAQFHAFA